MTDQALRPWRRILVSPDIVLALLFRATRDWYTDDIPSDAKVVDAGYDDDFAAFVLTIESPSFSPVSVYEPPILDVVMHTKEPPDAPS